MLAVNASLPTATLLVPVVSESKAVLPIFIFVSVNLSEDNVLIPDAFNPVVFPNISNPLAVITPTESTFVTS